MAQQHYPFPDLRKDRVIATASLVTMQVCTSALVQSVMEGRHSDLEILARSRQQIAESRRLLAQPVLHLSAGAKPSEEDEPRHEKE